MSVREYGPYLVYVRCQSWRRWPSRCEIGAPSVSANIGGASVRVTFRVATYGSGVGGPQQSARGGPPAVVYDDQNHHSLSENKIVLNPDIDNQLGVKRVPPKDGEVDLSLVVHSDSELDADALEEMFPRFLHIMLAYFNYQFRDALVPVAPIQLVMPDSGTFVRMALPQRIRALAQPDYDETLISEALAGLAARCSSLSTTELNLLQVAARRMCTAQREDDRVDSYCDLWEVCEFLCQHVKAKGGTVGRVAQALHEYTGLPKSKIENGLRLRDIYALRGDLVHEGVEDKTAVDKNATVLEAVASQLFAARLGVAYAGSAVIDSLVP